MSDNEDLNINIGADPSGVESGSKAAAAAINKVQQEAGSLDRAFRALRGSLDPLYAAQTRYNESLANSDRLLAAGRISQEEYAASINAATNALSKESAAQLRGTQVANQAAAAVRSASRTKASAEQAANDVILASSKSLSTGRAAEEARVTAAIALEAKNRATIAVQEAKARFEAASTAAANIPSVNRNAQGQFVSAASVAASRAADEQETAEILRLAELDSTAANQKSRNAQRVANTREEAARRAVVAEQSAQEAAVTAAAVAATAAEEATAATLALTAAQETAAAAAVAAAQQQVEADAAVAAAVAAKAEAAGIAAAAEEAAAKATLDAAAADAKAAIEARKLEVAQRREEAAEAARVASANRLKAALDPAFAAQMRYNASVELANKLAVSNPDIVTEEIRLNAVTKAHQELEKALKAGTGTKLNNKAVTEGLTVVHEALEHRFTRMQGSVVILAQALMGEEAAAKAVAFALSPVGLAIIGITAVIGAAVVATVQYEEAQRKLMVSTLGLGAASGVSAAEINQLADSNLNLKSSIKDNLTSLQAYAAAGVRSGQALSDLKATTDDFASLTGQKTKEAVKELAEAMKDPAKGAVDLNDKLSFLDSTQLQEIQTLQNMGEKYKAQALLASLLKQHNDELAQSSGGLQSGLHALGVVFSDIWTILGKVGSIMNSTFQIFSGGFLIAGTLKGGVDVLGGAFNHLIGILDKVNQVLRVFIAYSHGGVQAVKDLDKQLADSQTNAQQKQDSSRALPIVQETPEGKDQTAREKLAGGKKILEDALVADIRAHGEHSDAVKRDRQSLQEYSDTLARTTLIDKDYHNELQRQTALMDLQAKLANARHAHNKTEADDIGKQIFALKHYNELATDADLSAADKSAGGLAAARIRPKSDKTTRVAEWAQDLHDTEIQSKNFFADETDTELSYWQKKQALTVKGSKEWLEVQAKIYELAKKQAHENYDDDISALKDKIAAAKGNLNEEKTAWANYIAYIKEKNHEGSKEYINAQKELRAAQDEMAQFQNKLTAAQEKVAEGPVTRKFDVAQTQVQSKQEDIGFKQSGGAISDNAAAQQQRALVAQEIALEEQKEQTISEMQIAALEKQKAQEGLAPEHIAEINDKIEELQQAHEDRMQAIRDKSLLDWQKANDSVANVQVQKWKSVADAITGSLANTFQGMINKSITFQQSWKNLVGSIESVWINMAAKSLETWVMSLIQKQVVTKTAETINTATVVAGQVTQTAAVAAGTTARVGITAAGAAQEKSINLLASLKIIGMHAAKAAAGAYASLAGIPIIGPILGAAAAVATFAAVLAFGSLVSAEGGQGQVPHDGQITELHKDEMVLPAKFATPLRKQLLTKGSSDSLFADVSKTGGDVRNSTVNSNRAGDTHFQFSPTVQHHDTSWDRLVQKEGSNMRRWVNNEIRSGRIAAS